MRLRRHINYRISNITIIWIIVIFIFSLTTRSIVDFTKIILAGYISFNLFVCTVLCILGLIFINHTRKLDRQTALVSLLLVIFAILIAFSLEEAIESIHLLIFGILGFLSFKDQDKTQNVYIKILLASLTGLVTATADEILQSFIPRRFYDTKDIFFGLLGAIAGAVYPALNRW